MVVWGYQSNSPKTSINFSFELPSEARTSAGVFDATGGLIRTLWSNRELVAGKHSGRWDGMDDLGRSVPADLVWTVKVLRNNVDYQWDGVIGNTEGAWTTGTHIWDGLAYIPTQLRFSFTNHGIWAVTGYSEGTINLLTIDPGSPNLPKAADEKYANQNIRFTDIDSDGIFLYLANAGAWSGTNFVTKLDATSGKPVRFAYGSPITFPNSWKGIPMSGIDTSPKSDPIPNAIAVENYGHLLAVAHASADEIRFFDKEAGIISGNPLHISKPQSIAFTSKGCGYYPVEKYIS